VLCNKLYLIKVNSIKKVVILDKKGKIRAGATAAFSEENEITITKIN
jgi:hypothetical protein